MFDSGKYFHPSLQEAYPGWVGNVDANEPSAYLEKNEVVVKGYASS